MTKRETFEKCLVKVRCEENFLFEPVIFNTSYPIPIRFRLVEEIDEPIITNLTNAAYLDSVWFKKPPGLRAQKETTLKYLQEKHSLYIMAEIDVEMVSDKSHLLLMNQTYEGIETVSHVFGSIYISFHGGSNINDQNDDNPVVKHAQFGLLAVNPTHQRQGLGKRLVKLVETIAFELGYPLMKLKVVNVQQHLLRFYQNLGYEILGCEDVSSSDIQANQPVHFVIFEKSLATNKV